MKSKFLRACMRKLRNMDISLCWEWSFGHSSNEEKAIPSDVPKGHLAVYVGECYKRYVIKVTLLKHPLLKSLLEQAEEVYDFNADSRLCIPCDENMFLSVVQCARSPSHQQLSICL